MSYKIDTFRNEINWIKSPKIREYAELLIDGLPDYFFEVAASSTGKYHPAYALGKGGLVRHTKAAVTIAHDLLGLEMYGRYSDEDHDIILLTLMIHDGLKHGKVQSRYTVFDHPIQVADFVCELDRWDEFISAEAHETMCACLKSHMGQWNVARNSSVVLPKPETAMEKFVHQCDYLASRRYLEMDFDKISYGTNRV